MEIRYDLASCVRMGVREREGERQREWTREKVKEREKGREGDLDVFNFGLKLK